MSFLGLRTKAFEGLERDPEQDPMPDMLFNQGYSGLQVLIATNRKAKVVAALENQLEEIESVINYQTPKLEKTAVHHAIDAGWGADVALLAKAGANLELKDKDGQTALHYAVTKKDISAATALLEAGANVNARQHIASETPLQLAITSGDIDMVKLLVAHKADVSLRTPLGDGLNAYHMAASQTPEMMQVLLQHEGREAAMEFCKIEKHKSSALRIALSHSDLPMVTLLLDYGVSVNEMDDNGETPLFHLLHHRDSRDKSMKFMKLLIENGADISKAENFWSETPLFAAARTGYHEAVELLLDLGASPDHRSHLDETPLHLAAETYDVKTVQMLIDAGAEIDARNRIGRTALHVAAHANRLDVVKALLEAGADPFAKDNKRKTPDELCLADFQKNTRREIEYKQMELEYSAPPQKTAVERMRDRQVRKNHPFKHHGNRR